MSDYLLDFHDFIVNGPCIGGDMPEQLDLSSEGPKYAWACRAATMMKQTDVAQLPPGFQAQLVREAATAMPTLARSKELRDTVCSDALSTMDRVMTKPTCYADALIAADRESHGELLRRLEAIDSPSYGELLAKHILQAANRSREGQARALSDRQGLAETGAPRSPADYERLAEMHQPRAEGTPPSHGGQVLHDHRDRPSAPAPSLPPVPDIDIDLDR